MNDKIEKIIENIPKTMQQMWLNYEAKIKLSEALADKNLIKAEKLMTEAIIKRNEFWLLLRQFYDISYTKGMRYDSTENFLIIYENKIEEKKEETKND
jgi:plasmid maintenance system antidote protein VapI